MNDMGRSLGIAIAAWVFSGAVPAAVGPFSLVKDLAAGTASSTPGSFAVIGGTAYFAADDGVNGRELWKSDGTTAGTVLVKDIRVGAGSSNPENLVAVGGTLFFRADDGVNGVELWKSDGTAAGTVLVKDINAGSLSSNPSSMVAFGNVLLFNAETAANARELWRSDGTAAGTSLVLDIAAGAADANPRNLTVVGGSVLFVATDSTNGAELWTTDGTPAGTVLVKDIRPGSSGSSPGGLVAVGNLLFFTANDGSTGIELWKSDGSAAGTILVADLTAGAGSTPIGEAVAFGGKLFFVATTAANGAELWSSDGTGAGTTLLKDIAAGATGSNPASLFVEGSRLYFSASDGTNGRELWSTDGTAGGTAQVKDIRPGATGSFPAGFVGVNGVVYFFADDGTNGREIWRSDGTPAGTRLLAESAPGSASLTPSIVAIANGRLLLQATSASEGTELHAIPVGVPDAIAVQSRSGVLGDVIFDPVTISGIDHPVNIRIEGDLAFFGAPQHSIGCTGTYTNLQGLVSEGQSVCVKHFQAAPAYPALGRSAVSSLVVGGVAIAFTSTSPLFVRFDCSQLYLTEYGSVFGSRLDCPRSPFQVTEGYAPAGSTATLTGVSSDTTQARPWKWFTPCTPAAMPDEPCPAPVPSGNFTVELRFSYFTATQVLVQGPGVVAFPPADRGAANFPGWFPPGVRSDSPASSTSRTIAFTLNPDTGAVLVGAALNGCEPQMQCACDVATGTCSLKVLNYHNAPRLSRLAAQFGYRLQVSRTGTGAGDVAIAATGVNAACGSQCDLALQGGLVVTLTATPTAGSVFAGWGGACTGTGACNVTMDAAKNVTATFNVQQFALTIAKTGGGAGVVTSTPGGIDCGATCSANFNSGASVALGAAPSADSFFAGWGGGGCSGTGACNVTMSAAQSVTATFKLNTTIPRLANISTRMQVLTGNDVLIGGFIIGGTQPKTVVVRARGPSLIPFGITNALLNPTMQLFSGQTVLATNDDWGTAANAAAISSSGFAPSSAQESAILTTLGPGAYTAVVSGVGGTTGVGIIEVFEVDRPEVPLANISTRGQVLTGNDVMIGGFVIQGDSPQTVTVRARGPSLIPFGITNALADPVLELLAGQVILATNDDWQSSADAAAIQASGFAPSDAKEAVIRITLPPGAYTAIVRGKNGGTGVGIIEAFAQ